MEEYTGTEIPRVAGHCREFMSVFTFSHTQKCFNWLMEKFFLPAFKICSLFYFGLMLILCLLKAFYKLILIGFI